ncbi:uroporphyrinogen decarboxylase [Dehalogenimonas lykanthroporepellens BL-DC-9]|jgi:uroporphyrinogen decarboxylase|nr:uroporphyrinogen decarboxylase [Dehalogenimonas lykanthroporepellens BL-DC-9]
MNHRERLQAIIQNQPIDRVPVAFWRHWPGDDQDADSLARVTLDFQKRYDLDFMKLPVSSVFCVEDYGLSHAYRDHINGDREFISRIIQKPGDWSGIGALNVTRGTYGWHLRAVEQVIADKDKDTPFVITIFNPLAMASYLAGDELLLAHLREYPDKVNAALAALTETTELFISACFDRGIDGVFFSTRFASYELMSAVEYLDYGQKWDLEILKNSAKGGWFNILHLHGQHPMMSQLAEYPVQAVNWHDRTSDTDLGRAAQVFPGVLMGGIEQQRFLVNGSPADVNRQAVESIDIMGGNRLILAPGCTFPLSVPEANLRAVRNAVI